MSSTKKAKTAAAMAAPRSGRYVKRNTASGKFMSVSGRDSHAVQAVKSDVRDKPKKRTALSAAARAASKLSAERKANTLRAEDIKAKTANDAINSVLDKADLALEQSVPALKEAKACLKAMRKIAARAS